MPIIFWPPASRGTAWAVEPSGPRRPARWQTNIPLHAPFLGLKPFWMSIRPITDEEGLNAGSPPRNLAWFPYVLIGRRLQQDWFLGKPWKAWRAEPFWATIAPCLRSPDSCPPAGNGRNPCKTETLFAKIRTVPAADSVVVPDAAKRLCAFELLIARKAI